MVNRAVIGRTIRSAHPGAVVGSFMLYANSGAGSHAMFDDRACGYEGLLTDQFGALDAIHWRWGRRRVARKAEG